MGFFVGSLVVGDAVVGLDVVGLDVVGDNEGLKLGDDVGSAVQAYPLASQHSSTLSYSHDEGSLAGNVMKSG